MYIAGLYIAIDPDAFDLIVPEIRSMYHIELKSLNPSSGKLLVQIASDEEKEQKQALDIIKALPFVMAAEIIYFYQNTESDENARQSTDIAQNTSQLYKSYNAIVHTRH